MDLPGLGDGPDREVAGRMAAAAVAWLESLAPDERSAAQWTGPGTEWDNTQRGANHAHSVWRDPQSDFGLDVLAAHRAEHHAG